MGVGMFSAALALISEGAGLKPPLSPVGIIQRNTSSGLRQRTRPIRRSLEVGSRANIVIRLKRCHAGSSTTGMLEFQQILNGIDGHAGKLPSIISPCHPSPLLPFVLAAVQPCSAAFRIHHVTFICPELKLFSLTVFLKLL